MIIMINQWWLIWVYIKYRTSTIYDVYRQGFFLVVGIIYDYMHYFIITEETPTMVHECLVKLIKAYEYIGIMIYMETTNFSLRETRYSFNLIVGN